MSADSKLVVVAAVDNHPSAVLLVRNGDTVMASDKLCALHYRNTNRLEVPVAQHAELEVQPWQVVHLAANACHRFAQQRGESLGIDLENC